MMRSACSLAEADRHTRRVADIYTYMFEGPNRIRRGRAPRPPPGGPMRIASHQMQDACSLVTCNAAAHTAQLDSSLAAAR